MVYVYIAAILFARVIRAVFNKRSSNRISGVCMSFRYISYQYAISALLGLVLLFFETGGKPDVLTLLISALSGISLFFSSLFGIYGMKSGTISLVSIFSTAGLIIPIAAGVFMFDRPISLMQGVGVGIFFISAWLLIKSSRSIYGNFSFKTLLLLLGAMAANGITMLAQQMYTYYAPNGSISMFSFISFGLASVFGAGMSFIVPNNEKQELKIEKDLIICGIALAGAIFVINQFVTVLTVSLPPVLLFTLVNGGGTVISAVTAAVMYKERLSAASVAGIIAGVISLIIIKAF